MEKILQKNKKRFNFEHLIKFLKLSGLLLLFYVLNYACVIDVNLFPFAISVMFAFIFCKINGFAVIGTYFISSILTTLSVTGLFISGIASAVALFVIIFHKIIKKPIKQPLIYLYAIISYLGFLYFNLTGVFDLLKVGFAILLGLVFLYITINFISSSFIRGFNFKLNLDEIICAFTFLLVFFMGISNIPIFYINLTKVLATLLLLIFAYKFSVSSTLILSIIIGMTDLIYNGSLTLISVFIIYALCILAFIGRWRFLSVIACIFAELLLGVLLDNIYPFSYFSLISVAIGGVIFLLLPMNFLNYICELFGGKLDKLGIRNVVNRSKENICNRLIEVSKVFNEMDLVFRSSVHKNISKEDGLDVLKNELVSKVCGDCPEKNKCLRVNGEFTTEIFDSIINVGFDRGKISLLDMPQYLTAKCGRINFLLSTINNLLVSYKQVAIVRNNMDSSKVLIADQLNGLSSLLTGLAKEINLNVTFDEGMEKRIIENLSYKNIICYEAIVFDSGVSNASITLLIKNQHVYQDIIEKVVSATTKKKLMISSITPSELMGIDVVNLKLKPNFDIVFGIATRSKYNTRINGDSQVLTKIDDGKYMVALSDGMGSGQRAQQISNLTINLIENFYKAGFDNEIILSSVNKLLALNNEEEYSTLDLCVMDFVKNFYDFIKLGATYGFLKRKNSIEIIFSSGLPIGVLEDVTPHITKKLIDAYDMVILLSDGITERWNNIDNLKNYILNNNAINPQILCDDLLKKTLELEGSNDDMTIVAIRVFPT